MTIKKRIILACSIAALTCFLFSCNTRKASFSTHELVQDMKLYKTPTNLWHSGDLFEHSVWVAQTIVKWFTEKHPFVEGIDESNKKVLVFAGFLHDIGKGGDQVYKYYTKPDHPQDGFNYLIGKKDYIVSKNNTRFDFKTWLKAQGFSDEEYRLITVLAGGHTLFGKNVLKPWRKKEKHPHELFDDFVKNLELLASQACYNNGVVTEQFVRMAVLISAADLYGMNPVKITFPIVCVELPEIQNYVPAPHQKEKIMYDVVNPEEDCLFLRKLFFEYFTEKDPKGFS
jgi:hypothetical protein